MANVYRAVNADQSAFVKLLDSMTGKYSRWQIWCDMVLMLACAISNSVDVMHYDEREQMYIDAVKKYSKDEQDKFSRLSGILIESMDERVSRGDFGDFLGEIFMSLNLGNELGGQFFTPYHVCLMMAKAALNSELIHAELSRHGYISCADVACGAGATLIAAAEILNEIGINYQENVMFVGQDIDSTTALMCYIQLSLIGCPGYVVIGNSLTEPATGHALFGENTDRCWKTPMYYRDLWQSRRRIENQRRIIRGLSQAPEKPGQMMFKFGS